MTQASRLESQMRNLAALRQKLLRDSQRALDNKLAMHNLRLSHEKVQKRQAWSLYERESQEYVEEYFKSVVDRYEKERASEEAQRRVRPIY